MKSRFAVISLVFVVLMLPLTAHAAIGDIIQLLVTITDTLKGGIGQVLVGIQKVNKVRQSLQQQVVWPVSAINQAKSSVLQTRGEFTTLANKVHEIEVSSATLADTKQFESILRAAGAVSVSQVQPAFFKVFGSAPAATDATTDDRNLVDVDDALAAGALKTAVLADTATNRMLNAADALERQAAATAPGAAPLVTAQAQVLNLENQAYLKRLLAAELRQDAARLAHDNALIKRSAEENRTLRDHVNQVLSR